MSERRRKAPRVLDRVADWLSWGAALCLLAQPLAAGYLPPVTAFHNNRHLLLPILFPLLVYSLVRRRLAMVPAAVGCVAWLTLVPGWLTDPAAPSGPADLRIVTLNLGDQISDPERVAQTLESIEADLVLLQEVGRHHEDSLRPTLADLYAHQVWYPKGRTGKAVLSRFVIRREDLLELGDGALALDATIVADERTVRVLDVHHRGWVGLIGRLSPGVRAVEQWAADRRDEGAIALIAGDFNSSSGSAVLDAIEAAGYENAFDQVGGGAGSTFPAAGRYRGWPLGPTHRLDHVLHGPRLDVIAAEVGPDASSDHLPLVVDLRFRLPGAPSPDQ